MASSSVTRQPDVAVIGAGFGGLATALTLAEQGVKVALFERLNYPGGCASTFTRRKHRFESGATLFSGFDQGQLFQRWIERHGMEVEFQTHDPIVQLRAPDFNIDIGQDRHALIRQFSDMPGAPVRGLVKFFHNQKAIADILWEVMNDERLLPPFGAKELLAHAMRTPKYTKLLPLVCKPLSKAVKSWGAGDFEPLRIYLDALCQITVQVPSHEAEAPFAMGAMDYYFRGTGHIRGGIGNLATAMVRAIDDSVGEIHKRPLREAGFSVLKAADIPSVLVEVGFLSTDRDLENLQDPEWRAKMARGIRDGILAWSLADATIAPLRRK